MTHLKVPKLKTEAEEAKWWYDNRDKLSDEFDKAAKEGRLRRGGLQRLLAERGTPFPQPNLVHPLVPSSTMALTEAHLATWLDQTIPPASPANGTVILLCGISGAGKTTAAQHLESKGFLRLSIDEEIWSTYGRYGIDYPAAEYPNLQKQAASAIWTRLEQLLQQKSPTISAVIDNSFWKKETRDQYKQLIESHQRPWILIYLKVPAETLRSRLLARQTRFDANAAFPIGDELLNKYLESFQPPSGEGELIFS